MRDDNQIYDFNSSIYDEILAAPSYNTDNLNIFCTVENNSVCKPKYNNSPLRKAWASPPLNDQPKDISGLALSKQRIRKVGSHENTTPSASVSPKTTLHTRNKAASLLKAPSPMGTVVGRRILGPNKNIASPISTTSSHTLKPVLSHHHLHHLPLSPRHSPRIIDKKVQNLQMDQIAIYFAADQKNPTIIQCLKSNEVGHDFRGAYDIY